MTACFFNKVFIVVKLVTHAWTAYFNILSPAVRNKSQK